jgi:lipopolysaccharide transport system permease protein
LLNPFRAASDLWEMRGLLGQFTARLLSERHRGSYLGLLWAILHPLLMLGVYTFVFAVVWQAKWGGTVGNDKGSFALTLFAGLLIFDVFSAGVAPAPGLIVENPNYVKKVVFPLEVLPIAAVASSLALGSVGLCVLLLGKAIMGGGESGPRVSPTLYMFPLLLPGLLALTAGVTLFLASLGVFLRDIRPLVQGLVLQVLFFMTPIFYPVERVPEWLRGVLAWNPLAVYVEAGRRTLVEGRAPDWPALAIITLVSLAVFQFGFAFFMKSKRGFADVL